MIVFFVVVFILVFCFTSDISREYDLKEDRTKEERERREETDRVEEIEIAQEIEGRAQETDELPRTEVIDSDVKRLLRDVDFILLVSLGFLMSFSVVAFLDVAMPIYGKQFFDFSSRDTGAFFFANGFLFIVVVSVTKRVEKISEFSFLIIGLCLFGVSTSLLLAVSIIRDRSYYLGVIFFCIYVLLLGVCWCVEQVFVRSLFTKLVPSVHQAFAEGVRRSASSVACIVASVIVPYMLQDLYYLCAVVLMLTGCAVYMLFSRKTSLEQSYGDM